MISGYALFCFYNVLETWMLSFFSMLTLVRLAEIPWIWVDTDVYKRQLMDRYFVQDGEIVENLNEKHLCRTQIRVSLPQGLDTLLREPIGNHHLIVLGHYARRVQEIFRFR